MAKNHSNTSKTLLFQAHSSNLLGGGEYSLLALLEDSVERGFDTHVIVPTKGPFVAAAQKVGAKTHIIHSYWWTSNGRNERHPKRNLKAVDKTLELVTALQPLLCVTNTITTPWLAYAAHAKSIPHTWILREYGDTDHGLSFWVSKKEICRMVGELSDKVFANSEILREYYEKMVGHKDIGIINPYVKKPITKSVSSPFRNDALKLVCTGNLSEGKGQFDAVKATKILKDKGLKSQLFVLGTAAETTYEAKIRAYISEYHLEEEVTLAGYIPNPADYVAFADLSLVCSRTETFGRVTIESLLLNTLVIGTNSANTKKLLKDNSEILYTFGNPEELAEKISALHKKPAAYKKRLTADLKSTVETLYSPERVHQEFFAYISRLDEYPADEGHHSSYEPLMKLLQSQKQVSLPEIIIRKMIFFLKSVVRKPK